jgi:hypothetical protein
MEMTGGANDVTPSEPKFIDKGKGSYLEGMGYDGCMNEVNNRMECNALILWRHHNLFLALVCCM